MQGIVKKELYTRVDTFLAEDKCVSMVADCRVPIVTKEDRKAFMGKESRRPSIASKFSF